jgi:hypothetical protein
MKLSKVLLPFSLLFLLSSCFGISFDIELNDNGSGTIVLEYRISQSLDSLGRLEGNERWNSIPVGRADFERTLDRLPGMNLLSFSSNEDERDLIINARMGFDTIQALLSFFDAGGRRSNFLGDAGSGRLLLTLSEGIEINNPGLIKLITEVFDSYSVNMSMTFPTGRRVSFSYPIYEILLSPDEIVADFSW